MPATATPPVRPRRTAADWAGFTLLSAFALALPLGAGKPGLLLLPPMLYELLVAATFLVRGRARRTTHGIGPRVAAYGASFLVPVFLWTAARLAPEMIASSRLAPLRSLGTATWLAGTILSFWPVWHLRRSFSIEPAARELATSGPYAYARHPIYGTHTLLYTGTFLLHATPAFAVVLAAWLLLLRVRVRYEERVLRAEYPEYDAYHRRVGAFAPRLAPARPRAARE